jgi:hypothetical protein
MEILFSALFNPRSYYFFQQALNLEKQSIILQYDRYRISITNKAGTGIIQVYDSARTDEETPAMLSGFNATSGFFIYFLRKTRITLSLESIMPVNPSIYLDFFSFFILATDFNSRPVWTSATSDSLPISRILVSVRPYQGNSRTKPTAP